MQKSRISIKGAVSDLEVKMQYDCDATTKVENLLGCIHMAILPNGTSIIVSEGIEKFPIEVLYLIAKHLYDNSIGIEKKAVERVLKEIEGVMSSAGAEEKPTDDKTDDGAD